MCIYFFFFKRRKQSGRSHISPCWNFTRGFRSCCCSLRPDKLHHHPSSAQHRVSGRCESPEPRAAAGSGWGMGGRGEGVRGRELSGGTREGNSGGGKGEPGSRRRPRPSVRAALRLSSGALWRWLRCSAPPAPPKRPSERRCGGGRGLGTSNTRPVVVTPLTCPTTDAHLQCQRARTERRLSKRCFYTD